MEYGDGEQRIVSLLRAWSSGDETAQAELVPLVYEELRRQARHHRKIANAGETFRTTALVHEAYLRLARIGDIDWRGRGHFFALSAQLMRRILVDSARARARLKRGGPHREVFTPEDWQDIAVATVDPEQTLILDDALSRLSTMDPRRGKIVELRVFGGLDVHETAHTLEVSESTVAREWRLAKAWLLRELGSV